ERITVELASVRDVEAALSCELHPDVLALVAVAGTVNSEYIGSLEDVEPLTEDARRHPKAIAPNRVAIGSHPDRHAWYLVTANGKGSRIIERDNFDGSEVRYPLVDWLDRHVDALLDRRTAPATPEGFRVEVIWP
ncbi:MAG: hypothetical protein AAGE52_39130, partial [Myxococcota bacterium]